MFPLGAAARRPIVFGASLFYTVFVAVQILGALSQLQNTVYPEIYLNRAAVGLAAFFLSILGGWYAFRIIGGAIFACFATVMVFFVGSVASSSAFIWFLLEYAAFCYVLFRCDADAENQLSDISVDREKYQNERNDLEIAHKAKGEGISILFEKYSTYYNLRKLGEELATTLSVGQLAQIIVRHAAELVNRGDVAILAVSDTDGRQLTMAGYRVIGRGKVWDPSRFSGGDLFDFWVIKNQRRLIVTDAHQDFRFDVKAASQLEGARSIIVAALMLERRVIGTLRIQSPHREAFTNDDLRLLDTIAVLASSALSNAMLFERTEELAIKDSLTGLYVRRYFYDRLKEEHRRALITQRPLSILMCDLDFFKDVNDRYGHGVGDQMLIEFARLVREVSDNAIAARYGGEEFSMLLPDTPKAEAVELAEKLRSLVEKAPFSIRRERISMTVSIGVSSLPEDALDLEAVMQKADDALYRAKREGRNRVCSSAG